MPVSEREALEQRVEELTRETERLDAELAARQATLRAPREQHLAVLQQELDALADANVTTMRRLDDLRAATSRIANTPEALRAWFFRQGYVLGAWFGSAALAWRWLGVEAGLVWLAAVPAAALIGYLTGRSR